MKKRKYSRPLSFNERFFLVFDAFRPPVANQYILEGEGDLDLQAWQRAVEAASEANPGSRVVVRGHLGFTRLADSGKTPPVREVDGTAWSGKDPDNAPFLKDPLYPRKGPMCEILLVKGSPKRVIFRTHHAAMDGSGTFTWITDIFRALNGRDCRGSDSILTDTELALRIQPKSRKPFPFEHIAPTGKADPELEGMTWRRRTIPGTYGNLTAKIAILLAREAWKYNEGIVRIGIPVDLRQYDRSIISTGNLTFAIYVEVGKDSTEESIKQDIATQLSSFPDGIMSKGDDIYRHLPISLMAWKAEDICRSRLEENIYSISGLISNVKTIDISRFKGAGFTATGFWAVPPGGEYFPVVLGTCNYNDNTEIIISVPRALATEGRADALLDSITAGLQS